MIGVFTASDLVKYTEFLLKEVKLLDVRSEESNYSWLKAKNLQQDACVEDSLGALRPMIQKLSPESCTAVAVKLDILTEMSTSTEHILTTLKTLLQEQASMTIIAGNVKRAKETNYKKVKVHPVLDGRKPTVSFVVYSNKI